MHRNPGPPRQKKTQATQEKGRGRPFTISRQRMSILLIRRLLSDPYFKHSYRFSPHEIENLIQCIGPYVDVAPTGRTSAPNGIIPLETKVLAMIQASSVCSAKTISINRRLGTSPWAQPFADQIV